MGTELVADTEMLGPVGLGEGYLGRGFIWVGMRIGWFAIVPISPLSLSTYTMQEHQVQPHGHYH